MLTNRIFVVAFLLTVALSESLFAQQTPDQIALDAYKRGDKDLALKKFSESLDSGSHSLDLEIIYMARGLIYFQDDKYKLAISDFSEVIGKLPNCLAEQMRGNCYLGINELDNAEKDYTAAIEGDGSVVVRECLIKRAQVYLYKEKNELAIQDLDRAIGMSDQDRTAYLLRGSALFRTDRDDEAFSDFAEALRLGDDSGLANRVRGDIYKDQGSLENAIEEYTSAIVEPKSTQIYKALLGRGNTYLLQSDFQNALLDFAKAEEIEPKANAPMWKQAAALVGLKKHAEALAFANKAIETDPGNADGYWVRAIVYRNLKKFDLAIADCETALRINPEQHEPIKCLGRCFFDQNKYETALTHFVRYLDKVPLDEEAMRFKARCYLLDDDSDIAKPLVALSQLLKAHPSNSYANRVLPRLISELRKNGHTPKVVSVELDNELSQKVVKRSPIMEVPRGVKKSVTDSVEISRSFSIADSWSVGAELRASGYAWIAEVEAAVKGEISKTTTHEVQKEIEQERGVEISGGNEPVRVLWVNYYLTGRANCKLGETEFTLPFEIHTDFDLIVERIEPRKVGQRRK